jgi:hypothetical protein
MVVLSFVFAKFGEELVWPVHNPEGSKTRPSTPSTFDWRVRGPDFQSGRFKKPAHEACPPSLEDCRSTRAWSVMIGPRGASAHNQIFANPIPIFGQAE